MVPIEKLPELSAWNSMQALTMAYFDPNWIMSAEQLVVEVSWPKWYLQPGLLWWSASLSCLTAGFGARTVGMLSCVQPCMCQIDTLTQGF